MTGWGDGESRTAVSEWLYREAVQSSPDLRGQLEALNEVARVTSCDPEDVARARSRLFSRYRHPDSS